MPFAAADAELVQAGETPEDFARLFDRYAVTIHRYAGSVAGALPWLYGIATNLIHRGRRGEVRQYRAYARSEPAGFDHHSDPLATEIYTNRITPTAPPVR